MWVPLSAVNRNQPKHLIYPNPEGPYIHSESDLDKPKLTTIANAHEWAVPDVQRGLEPSGAELDSDVVSRAAAKSPQFKSIQSCPPPRCPDREDLTRLTTPLGTEHNHVVDFGLVVDLLIHGTARKHTALVRPIAPKFVVR